jgi:hypothetical protein
MALTSCPECRREVSDRAPVCPHCGCPISGSGQRESRQEEPQRVVHEQSGSFGTGFGGGAGCVLGVVVAVIALVVALAGFQAAAKCQNCDGKGRVLGGLVECPHCKGRGILGK